eukprot:jgi/Mesvir1/4488/Mv09572-RA.1
MRQRLPSIWVNFLVLTLGMLACSECAIDSSTPSSIGRRNPLSRGVRQEFEKELFSRSKANENLLRQQHVPPAPKPLPARQRPARQRPARTEQFIVGNPVASNCQKTSAWDCAYQCQQHIMSELHPCSMTGENASAPHQPWKHFSAARIERPYSAVTNKVLCFTAVAFIPKTIDNIMANILSSEHYCDWALISYSGEGSAWAYYIKDYSAPGHPRMADRVRIIADLRAPDLFLPYECGAPFSRRDKLRGWKQLIDDYGPILDQYAMIHLLDDDMVLASFDMEVFMDDVVCGIPLGPPMISQPTTRTQKIYFPYLRSNYWDVKHEVPRFVETAFVEFQAPILTIPFFRWLMDRVYLPQTHLLWDADIGLDHVWCNAARHYLVKVMKVPVADLDAGYALGCALYPRTAMASKDFQTLGDTQCNGYYPRAKVITAAYRAAYPFWYFGVHDRASTDERVLKRRYLAHVPFPDRPTCTWREVLYTAA